MPQVRLKARVGGGSPQSQDHEQAPVRGRALDMEDSALEVAGTVGMTNAHK